MLGEMQRLTVSVAAKTLFNVEISERTEELGKAFTTALEQANNYWVWRSIPFLRWNLPFTPYGRLYRATARLDRFVYQVIAERRASSQDAGDIISMLLAARAEDGTALSDRQVRDEALSDRAAVTSLYEALQRLPDPRRGQGKRYELARLFCLLLLAKLAGQTSLSGATEWIRHRGQEIDHHFGLRRTHMPCQMTYYRVLARIDAQMLDEILAAFFIRLRGRAAVRKRTQSAQRPARAISIMPSSPSMEKPFAQRASRPIRFICSVVMTSRPERCCGSVMSARSRMRSAHLNRSSRPPWSKGLGVRNVARQARYFNAEFEQAIQLILTGQCSIV
jgi:hypothetical protein